MLRKLHLNFVITLLTLMLCMGVLCNYSFAEDASSVSDFSNYIYDIYESCVVTTEYTDIYLNEAITNSQNFIHFYNTGEHIFVFGNKDYLTCNCGLAYGLNTETHVINGYNNSIGKQFSKYPVAYSGSSYSEFYAKIPVPNVSECIVYYMYVSSSEIICSKVVNRGSSGFQNISSANYQVALFKDKLTLNNNNGTYSALGLTTLSNNSLTDYVCYGNNVYAQYNGSFYCYDLPSYYTDNMLNPPPYVEDDRLSIYTLQTNNGKQLNIDLSAFRDGYSAAVIKTFSDVVITLDCDGSEIEYTLDSNNSNIIDIWSATNNVHTVQTLYNYFDLDSYDDVFISKVSFSLTTSSPGGSGIEDFNIACLYYLKDTNTAPITPEVIEDPTYNDTNIYNNTQINNIKQDLHEYSSRFSFLSGTWNFVLEQDLPEFPGWATVYTNYVWYADGNSDTTYRGHWFQMANNIPSIVDLTRPFDPSEFLEQNKTFAFYDVILLKVWTVEVLSGSIIETYDLAGYLVFISDRYYDHYNSRLNLDILTQLQLSAENTVMFYDVCKARLDSIASDLGIGFNGLLDTSTGTQYKIISWLQTVNDNMSGSFITLSNTLSDGFSSVVSAINNITPGGSSYSLPALSDALSFLFTPTLEWSAINYDDYEESLGVLALPFQFTFDVLDIAQNQYDPHFKLHLNELSLDVPLEAGEDPDMTNFTVIEDQDIEQDPLDVIPSGLWITLQYLNAFGLVMVQALSTYYHIFWR